MVDENKKENEEDKEDKGQQRWEHIFLGAAAPVSGTSSTRCAKHIIIHSITSTRPPFLIQPHYPTTN